MFDLPSLDEIKSAKAPISSVFPGTPRYARPLQDRERGGAVGVILGAGNVDMPVFQAVLAGQTPRVG